MKISLCLLTWNELEGCKIDVPKLPLNSFDQVFAMDGGSKDGTIDYLKTQGIKVYIQQKAGYNNAYIEAFQKCTSDALIIFHPKGSVNPEHTLRFRELFEQGYDLIVASRIINGSKNEEDDNILKPRKWFVMGLGFVAALLWRREGNYINDVLHGFRGMTKKAFFAITPLNSGLSIDLEMVTRSYKSHFKRLEFPVQEEERLDGESHFKAFPTGKKLLKYLWFEIGRK